MKEKILVINDDDGIREIIKTVLERKGYETYEASNGLEGIAQANQTKPDLILLDILMPGMSGFETCKRLKNDPATKEIPVIFLSSLSTPKDKIQGLELGAVDFINNAVDQGELLARVKTHLEIRSLSQALRHSNEELVRKQKSLDDDLHTAAIIQRSFLPSMNFKIGKIQLSALWLPANPLGGDIFNVIQCSNGKVIFYMIDVSGHDVPSALVTISVSEYLHQQNASSKILLSPKEMMVALDKEYPIERFDRYFTIFYLILDLELGNLTYSSAGHPPAIILKKNAGCKLLDLGGTIIGLNRNLPFEERVETLDEGDKVFLYTDGVIEMKNKEEELYGADRLQAFLESVREEPIDKMISALHQSLEVFAQGALPQDDVSIIGFEFQK